MVVAASCRPRSSQGIQAHARRAAAAAAAGAQEFGAAGGAVLRVGRAAAGQRECESAQGRFSQSPRIEALAARMAPKSARLPCQLQAAAPAAAFRTHPCQEVEACAPWRPRDGQQAEGRPPPQAHAGPAAEAAGGQVAVAAARPEGSGALGAGDGLWCGHSIPAEMGRSDLEAFAAAAHS